MVLFTTLFTILSYFNSSVKLTICGESAALEIVLLLLLIIALVYIHVSFTKDITEMSTEGNVLEFICFYVN